MTYRADDLTLNQHRKSSNQYWSPSQSSSLTLNRPSIRIECQAEERRFVDSSRFEHHSTLKPFRLSAEEPNRNGRFRTEIVIHSNPKTDLYIKRLRLGFNDRLDPSSQPAKPPRSASSPRSQTLRIPNQSKRKFRSTSLSRSHSQTILHQWIDDICANENLMVDEDIVFFLKNGEFLARI